MEHAFTNYSFGERPMLVNAMVFKVAALAGTAALLIAPDPQQLGIWAVFATSAAGIITNYINRRADQKEREQRHQWDVEAREAQAQQVKHDLEDAKRVVTAKTDLLRDDLAHNTAITIQAAQKADAAYDAANHVNEKIATIAKTQVVVKEIDVDTNQTAHRIEKKL